jgi:hypothetical protein
MLGHIQQPVVQILMPPQGRIARRTLFIRQLIETYCALGPTSRLAGPVSRSIRRSGVTASSALTYGIKT